MVDRVDRVNRVDRVDNVYKVDKVDRVDKVNRADKVDRVDKSSFFLISFTIHSRNNAHTHLLPDSRLTPNSTGITDSYRYLDYYSLIHLFTIHHSLIDLLTYSLIHDSPFTIHLFTY
jgi:hypothetical protein